jgi:hypothetical protein
LALTPATRATSRMVVIGDRLQTGHLISRRRGTLGDSSGAAREAKGPPVDTGGPLAAF